MSGKIKAGLAALKVIKSWGVKHIYGLPAGSLNAEMDMLYEEQENIDFIQVRHEEVGAIAAAMQPKFSGNIGVVLGPGGPGATHLMNGLYDAREDGVIDFLMKMQLILLMWKCYTTFCSTPPLNTK